MQWILSKHKSMMKNAAGLKTKDWNDGVKSFPIFTVKPHPSCADTGAAPPVVLNHALQSSKMITFTNKYPAPSYSSHSIFSLVSLSGEELQFIFFIQKQIKKHCMCTVFPHIECLSTI